jgi:O-antigen/teichoic acid export membrane protein
MFVVVGMLAGPVTRIALGPDYGQAATLTAVLAASGVVATLSQLLGTVLIAASVVRQMVWQNALAAVVNVVGNVLLVPVHGALASAWLTLVTELVVCGGALLLLPLALPRTALLRGTGRPALVVVLSGLVLLTLRQWPLPGLAAAAVCYAWGVRAWGLWPDEMRLWGARA